MDEKKMMQEIETVMRRAGEIILTANRTKGMTDSKSGRANFVTTYDKKVQEFLQRELLKILPEAIFMGEEEEEHANVSEGLAFVVDPIDGTTNFIKDYKQSCISVALLKDGKRYIGMVYQPYADEMFTAVAGQGAFLNGDAIHVTDCSLEESLVVFGTSPYYQDKIKRSLDLAYEMLIRCIDVRRSGSAAIDMCAVAAGRCDLYFELMLSPWDYAAAALIAEEAGAIVRNAECQELGNGIMTGVIVSNPIAFEEAKMLFVE